MGYFQLNKTCQLCPDIPGWVIPVAILVLFFVAVWLLKALAHVKMEDLSSLSIAISYLQLTCLYYDFNLQCVIRMTPKSQQHTHKADQILLLRSPCGARFACLCYAFGLQCVIRMTPLNPNSAALNTQN